MAPPTQALPAAAQPPTQPWTPPAGPPPPGWGQPPAGSPVGSIPPGYPAYQPASAPARRLPVGLIVGGVAAVLAVLVVGGVAASSLLAKPGPSPALPILPTPAPSVAVVPPSIQPAESTGPVVTLPPVESPGPVVTLPPVVIDTPAPEPSIGPTAAPAPSTPPGGEVVSVANISITIAAPWTVADTQDYSIQLVIPQKGGMALTSGTLQNATTADEWIQSTLVDDQKTDPNASFCGGSSPEAVTVPNGPPGKIAAICYTLTPQGGQAVNVVEIQMVGVDQAGTTVYVIDILASEASIQEILDLAGPLLPTVTWKLYQG
ncbi:MAG: hypothetical protein ACYC65_14855 [Candidatus Limnocylindrales bacterium]